MNKRKSHIEKGPNIAALNTYEWPGCLIIRLTE